MTDQALEGPLAAFLADVGGALAALGHATGLSATQARADAATDAFDLVAGLLHADGRLTDDELWALTGAFGPHLDASLAGAIPSEVRRSGAVSTAAARWRPPSALFELLVAADRATGTTWSHRYYRRATDLAFAAASIDLHTSPAELDAIESFRAALLGHLDRSGVPRPGQPLPRSRDGSSAPPPAPHPPAPAPPAPDGGPAATAPIARPVMPGPPEPEAPPEALEAVLAELDGLIGLDEVKAQVRRTAALARISQLRRDRGLPTMEPSRHLVFVGNPGTGKTTVARLLARIYRSLGVLPRGHLVETDRSQLVAGFVGQTAPMVRARFDEADGGVLLIDEAYALVRGSETDFGREAIDTIVKLVEDRRDSLVVIVAGYPDEMGDFIDANPGLRSRFPTTVHFADYDDDQLLAIFASQGERARYHPDPEATAKARRWLAAQPRTKGFGNGRVARNLFEATVAGHAARLAEQGDDLDEEALTTLTALDVPDLPPAADGGHEAVEEVQR